MSVSPSDYLPLTHRRSQDPVNENSIANKTNKVAKPMIRNVGFEISPENQRLFPSSDLRPSSPRCIIDPDLMSPSNSRSPSPNVSKEQEKPPSLTPYQAIEKAVVNGNIHDFDAIIMQNRVDLEQWVSEITLLQLTIYHSDNTGGYDRIARCIIDLAPNLLNARTSSLLRTPLHTAAEKGSAHNVLLLMEYLPNLELNVRDAWGNTPLHLAAANGDSTVYDKLVAAGAKTTIVNRMGLQAVRPQVSTSTPGPISDNFGE